MKQRAPRDRLRAHPLWNKTSFPENIAMDRELDRQEYETWDRVLTNVVPHDPIGQLYQDQDFLNRAVCRFACAGLANGEGVILVSTLSHWNGFHAQLEAENVDVRAAQKRGQLTVVDAAELLPRFMRDAMPDPAIFPGVFGNVVAEARARGGYSKVRVLGEMVNVLWERAA